MSQNLNDPGYMFVGVCIYLLENYTFTKSVHVLFSLYLRIIFRQLLSYRVLQFVNTINVIIRLQKQHADLKWTLNLKQTCL